MYMIVKTLANMDKHGSHQAGQKHYNYDNQDETWLYRILPSKLTYPLRNDGWKMKIPFKMVPLGGHVNFWEGTAHGTLASQRGFAIQAA